MDASARVQPLSSAWVLLTLGDRPEQLTRAVGSIVGFDPHASILIVYNGVEPDAPPAGADVLISDENLGVPAGRDLAVRRVDADVICFLDDDAEVLTDVCAAATREFASRSDLGAVSFKLVDEQGATASRHIPRPGGRSHERSGEVVGFLGGASAIRRTAYLESGGYWGLLRYGHEELDLSWRLMEHGWKIRYLADTQVFHPRSTIGRHADGWRLTGRNRVLVARRNLPIPLLVVHTLAWLVLGVLRARRDGCAGAYLSGWRQGWSIEVSRKPVRWATIARMALVGRPPVI